MISLKPLMLEKDPVTGESYLTEGKILVESREHLIELMDDGWRVTSDSSYKSYSAANAAYREGEYNYCNGRYIREPLKDYLGFRGGMGDNFPRMLYIWGQND